MNRANKDVLQLLLSNN